MILKYDEYILHENLDYKPEPFDFIKCFKNRGDDICVYMFEIESVVYRCVVSCKKGENIYQVQFKPTDDNIKQNDQTNFDHISEILSTIMEIGKHFLEKFPHIQYFYIFGVTSENETPADVTQRNRIYSAFLRKHLSIQYPNRNTSFEIKGDLIFVYLFDKRNNKDDIIKLKDDIKINNFVKNIKHTRKIKKFS